MPFILEGIVTTRNSDGSVNIAPMGPVVKREQDGTVRQFLFRPFQGSQTYQNLSATKQGVFHISDDVLLFARAVTKNLIAEQLPLSPAKKIDGVVISNSSQWYEFQIISSDTSSDRAEFEAEILHTGGAGSFLGFNRAKHAVIETAILATRLHLLEKDFVAKELKRFEVIIKKTAGRQERDAFELLHNFMTTHQGQAS